MCLSTNSKDEFEQPTADGKMSTYTMYMYIWCIYDYQTIYIYICSFKSYTYTL